MSNISAFPGDEPQDNGRVDFTKESPASDAPAGYTVPELDTPGAGALLSTEVRVVIGSSTRIFGFEAGKDVGYYTNQAGAKVGLLRGRTASINDVRVGGSHKISEGGITIVVNRKPRNG